MQSHDIYHWLGKVAVRFATLEANLNWLLCALIRPDEPMLAAIVTERTQFSKVLDLLEKLAEFDSDVGPKVSRLVKQIQPLRTSRNLFIHGEWSLRRLDEGKVFVTDAKIVLTKQNTEARAQRSWQKGRRQEFTWEQLQNIELELLRAIRDSIDLLHSVEQRHDA